MKRVLCVGNLSVDFIFRVSRFPAKHEKFVAKDFYVGLGGAASNVAEYLAILGFDVGFLGAVGDDEYGKQHLRRMARYGIDTRGVKIISGMKTGYAVVISAGEDKRMIKYPGANLKREIDFEYVGNFDFVHISADHPDLVEFCRNQGIGVSVDGTYNARADIVFLNEDEWIRQGKPENAVVMLNGGGARYRNIVIKRGVLDVVDTTGAGDSFVSGFLLGYLEGEDIETCLRLGITAAAHTVRYMGARHPMPRDELYSKMHLLFKD